MLLLEDHRGVRFHAGGQREGEESFPVFGVMLEALASQPACVFDGLLKTLHPRRIGLPLNPAQKPFLIQEKIAAQDVLTIQFLEQVASGNRHLAERLAGVARVPALELLAGFGEFLRVEKVKSCAQLRNCGECWGGAISLFGPRRQALRPGKHENQQ